MKTGVRDRWYDNDNTHPVLYRHQATHADSRSWCTLLFWGPGAGATTPAAVSTHRQCCHGARDTDERRPTPLLIRRILRWLPSWHPEHWHFLVCRELSSLHGLAAMIPSTAPTTGGEGKGCDLDKIFTGVTSRDAAASGCLWDGERPKTML